MWNLIIAVVLLIISYIITSLFAPRAQDAKPATIEEFDFPQTEEGTPQCVFFGECWTEDWTIGGIGNYRNRPIKASGGGGKK
jgi:hypothetical protein